MDFAGHRQAVHEPPRTGAYCPYVRIRGGDETGERREIYPATAPLKPCTFVHLPSIRACKRRESGKVAGRRSLKKVY